MIDERATRDPEFTLTTGPAGVYPRVLSALSQPITHYYDPAFVECFRRTEAKVGQVFGTNHEVILLQGEAIPGLEAAARSLVRPGMPVLNLISGVFGQGMSLWLTSMGAQLHELSVAYDEAIDPDAVDAYLDAHPDIELLCVVHCETPSGTLNDCARIGPIARAHGVLTLVDCVASLGGMPLDPDGWQLDVCVAAPQKCLGGTPGISLITVSPQAWAAIERNPAGPRGSFLSLLDWRDRWHGSGRFPYTPSVSAVHGLEAACDLFLGEGREAVYARHQMAAQVCRAGIAAMGLRLWPARDAIMSPCVTAVAVPDGLDQAAVCDYVRARYGVLISGGDGAGNLVRIGHMGLAASAFHPVVGLAALGRSLADLGAEVHIGDGLDAALSVLAELRRTRS
jgi:pyridoxamine---pyruvate transaminase